MVARHDLQAFARRDVLLGVEIDDLGADAHRKLGGVEESPGGERRSCRSASDCSTAS